MFEGNYEDRETCWIWNHPFTATPTEAARVERHFRGQEDAFHLERLNARIEWHTYNPKGDEEEIADLAEGRHELLLRMYDKAAEWFKAHPDLI